MYSKKNWSDRENDHWMARSLSLPSSLVASFHDYPDYKKDNYNISGVVTYLMNRKLMEKKCIFSESIWIIFCCNLAIV